MAQRINQGAIPDALRNFDQLPDSAIVRDKVVAGLFGCSVPTVWRMSKDGRIQKPVRPSLRITGWVVGGLRKVLAEA
jgi:predicted DNA-binding transcriptional regulator AlpA